MAVDVSPVAVLQAWVNAHPRYAYTVQATEQNGAGTEVAAVLRIAVDAKQQTEDVHVVRGAGAGSDIHWAGGDTVVVRGPGFAHMVAMRMNVRDSRLLSPRKNDLRTAIFARVTACFSNDAAHVRADRAASTMTLSLSGERGVACGPEYGDGTITSDRITIDAADGHPLERERLVGSTVVERWVITDLHVPT